MRFLLRISIPMDTGNARIRDGSLPRTIQSILQEQKPEAAYFTEIDGLRTGVLVVNLTDASQIPAVAEPWFLSFGATVKFHPVMTPEDLAKAGPAIEAAVKRY
jgi:Domain of unknown function (DUF3303)